MMKHPTLIALTLLSLSACATTRGLTGQSGPVKINPASLAANPAAYDGRQVEVVGLVVWEFERLGLYQSYGAYCRGAEKSAIAVDWHSWPGVIKVDNRRMALLRGTFRNRYGVANPGGSIGISNAAPGPGPLEPGTIVRWLSLPDKPCPKALP
jgi:hypothetical protein